MAELGWALARGAAHVGAFTFAHAQDRQESFSFKTSTWPSSRSLSRFATLHAERANALLLRDTTSYLR